MSNKIFSLVDIELTDEKEIFQIAIINLNNKLEILERYNFFINTNSKLSPFIKNLTGVTNDFLSDKPSFSEIKWNIYNILKNNILICHGVLQDYNALYNTFFEYGISYNPILLIDTVELSKIYFPTVKSYKLFELTSELNIVYEGNYHQADFDVYLTYKLILKIKNKILSLPDDTYKKVSDLLEKSSYSIYSFSNYIRNKDTISGNVHHIVENNYNFLDDSKEKLIFISSIPEEDYYNINLKNIYSQIVILKDSTSYFDYSLMELLSKKIEGKTEPLLYSIYLKILIWIIDTVDGDLSEINFVVAEKELLNNIIKECHIKESYYYTYALKKAFNSNIIVSNYKNLTSILNNANFKNYKLVFENKNILGTELKKLTYKELMYKNVLAELNININKIKKDRVKHKKIQLIRENLQSIVIYLYDMYLNESIYLYNEAIEFIIEDIEILYKSINELNLRLQKATLFLEILLSIIKNDDIGYYKYDLLNNFNSLKLCYFSKKKEQIIFNKIMKHKFNYLQLKKINTVKNIKKINNDIDISTTTNKLLIFKNDKYRDTYYTNRDKKLNYKYKNLERNFNFYNFYKDIANNKSSIYICYSSNDILNYQIYLRLIFEEILSFGNLEK